MDLPNQSDSKIEFVIPMFLALLICVTLCSCQERRSSTQQKSPETTEQPAPTATPSTNVSPNEFSLKIEVQSEPEPDKYFVNLSWNRSASGGAMIQRTDKNGNAKLFPITDSDESISDRFVAAGESYTYQFLQNENSGVKLRASQEVTIPKDTALSGSVELAKLQTLSIDGRLFLDRVRAITSGNDIQVKATEIHSNDSILETFTKGQRAAQGSSGRPGGKIIIEALRGHGTLQIILRGEDGGDGNPGAEGFTGRNGVKGQTARAGVNPSLTEAMQNAYRQQLAWLLANNITHPGHWQAMAGSLPIYICASQAGDGERGVDGGPGHDGGDGSVGGDSGSALAKVSEESDLKITITQEAGMGGNGGPGGRGGPGGGGGPPGDLDIGSRCTTGAKPGGSGERGRNGNQGRAGRAGLIKPYCIQMADKSLGDCGSVGAL